MRIGRACVRLVCALAIMQVWAAGAAAVGITDTAWVRLYNGPGNSTDNAIDIGVDGDKNVYVGGFSVGAGTGFDYAILKYDSNGVALWERRYNGAGNAKDTATAFWLDASANLYITGGSAGTTSGLDFATLKYDAAGNLLWEKRYNGPANLNDLATDLYVDDGGNVYVTGNSQGLGSGQDYYTIKYDAAGSVLWEKRFNSTGSAPDSARMVIVDGDGNVYVSGHSNAVATLNDYLTVKYNAAGVQQWSRRYDGSGHEQDRAYDIALDSQGNVYVVGASWGGVSHEDCALIKYRPNGDLAWAYRYDGPAGQDDAGLAVALDASDHIYLTGRSQTIPLPNPDEWITLRVDTAGTNQWVHRYTGPIAGDDAAGHGLYITDDGTIWVTGFSDSVLVDYTALAYDLDGNQIQYRRYYRSSFTDDIPYSVKVDADGFIYLTGSTRVPGSNLDFMTVKARPCVCPLQSDIDDDHFITALDLSGLIDIIFFGGNNIKDQGCPMLRFDFDCSGEVDALDLNAMISYMFYGGAGPCDPCTP